MHAPEALEILENPTQKEVEILGAFKYKENSAVLHNDNNILYPNKKPIKALKIISERLAGLPTVIISSRGSSNPSFSFLFNSEVSTMAAATKASATINPKVFKKLSAFHSTPNQSLKM